MVQLVPTLNEKRDCKLVKCLKTHTHKYSSTDALAQTRYLKITYISGIYFVGQPKLIRGKILL